MRLHRTTFYPLIAILLVFVSACSGLPSASSTRILTATQQSITLTLWHTQTGSAATTLLALVNDFQTTYPTLTIRVEQKSSEGELLQEGLARIAMNAPPDLVLADLRTLAELARGNALLNLDSWLNDPRTGFSEDERNDFFPGTLDAGRIANQLVAMPFSYQAIVLYYNADALNAAQVDVPRTWDEFAHIARVTTRNNTHGWAMFPSAPIFAGFLYSRGGSVLNETQTQAQFNTDAGTKTLELITALTNSGAAYLVDSEERAHSDFAQGRAALLFGTTANLLPLTDQIARGAKFQWGVANVPQNDPIRPATTMLGAYLAILRTTPLREEASWLLVRWLTSPAQSARWSRETLSVPLRLSAQTMFANNLPPSLQRLRNDLKVLPSLHPLPTAKGAGMIDAALVEMWASVAKGTDPATALKNTTTRVNRILGQIP